MSTYVLLPGAGGDSWYWHRVVPLLQAAGHEAIAVDLPAADDDAGIADYVDVVVDAIGDRRDVVLVAQSMGALYAPLVAERARVARLVLVCPMIPAPGETGNDWFSRGSDGDSDSDAPFDPMVLFFHDVPEDVVRAAYERGEPDQSSRPLADPIEFERWPDLPTRVIAGRHDRLFSLEFVQRLSRERIGIEPDVIDSGHLPALARPDELAAMLL